MIIFFLEDTVSLHETRFDNIETHVLYFFLNNKLNLKLREKKKQKNFKQKFKFIFFFIS